VFGLGDNDEVFVKLFSSPMRGDTPAACLADAGDTHDREPSNGGLQWPTGWGGGVGLMGHRLVNAVLGPEEQMTGKGLRPEA
jgi:hypothetical protein